MNTHDDGLVLGLEDTHMKWDAHGIGTMRKSGEWHAQESVSGTKMVQKWTKIFTKTFLIPKHREIRHLNNLFL